MRNIKKIYRIGYKKVNIVEFIRKKKILYIILFCPFSVFLISFSSSKNLKVSKNRTSIIIDQRNKIIKMSILSY